MASQSPDNLFQYFTTKNLTSAQINSSWPDWRARCKAYGKCWFRNKLYVSELDPNARMGDGQRVRPVSQQQFEQAPYRGPKEVLSHFNAALPQGVTKVSSSPNQVPQPGVKLPERKSAVGTRGDVSGREAARTARPAPANSRRQGAMANPPPAARSRNPVSISSSERGRTSRTPVQPQVRGGKISGNGCGSSLRQPVVEKMKRCMASQSYTIPKNCPITILDAERRRFLVVNRSVVTKEKSPRCFMNVPAGIAAKAGWKNPRPGNGNGSNMTPAGLFSTKVYGGRKYGPKTGVGIRCISKADCSNTERRYVLIHGAKRRPGFGSGPNPGGTSRTLGCTRLSDRHFREYHSKYVNGGKKKCPYFVYFDEGSCGKRKPSPSKIQAFNKKNGVTTRSVSSSRQ